MIKHMNKPFSQACENNKKAILDVLRIEFMDVKNVLELGSGTGQHATYMAPYLDHLKWQTSDLIVNHKGINQWIDDCPAENLLRPIEVDFHLNWPVTLVDGMFSANTLHIVSWDLVKQFFHGVAKHLSVHGVLCIYGPFNYDGKFTSESNANFELWLKQRDPFSGIRDYEDILILAESAGLVLKQDHAMPANNRLLVFKKIA